MRLSAVRRSFSLSALATVLAAGAAATVACRAAASESVPAARVATAGSSTDARPGADSIALRAAADQGRMQGAAGAKVWLIIVSDFQCPYCKMWHDDSYAAIRRDYIETGKVRVAYMNFPLDMHVQAFPAAEAAMCASAQNRFWPYESALYESQARWAAPGDQSQVFDSLATAVGADANRFRACTRSHVMRATVEADRDRMEQRGVRSTPTFYIGNQLIAGAQPTDVFRRALDAAVANPPAIPRTER